MIVVIQRLTDGAIAIRMRRDVDFGKTTVKTEMFHEFVDSSIAQHVVVLHLHRSVADRQILLVQIE